uniref:DDE-1 domain-containing protein n=1 Tax=Plectus sambesii TaxID=2011161 RepID=A0A914X438_9BILA
MTGALWTKIIKEFDCAMVKQNRKVLLFADNATCHKLEEGVVLKNVNIQFFPPNTTSIIQPLDQGIIHTFKVYYRQQIVRKQLLALEKGLTLRQFGKSLTVLEVLRMIERAWRSVTPTTIQNCFRKAGFLKTGDDEAPEVEEMVAQPQMPEDEFNNYVNCDEHLDCSGELTIKDILEEVRPQGNGQDKEEEDEEEEEVHQVPPPPPNRKEALTGLTAVQAYLEHMNVDLSNVDALEDLFSKKSGQELCT